MLNDAAPNPRPGARRDPLVGLWLVAICALVVAMILVGGLTRLTDSGLSITEWDLGKGLAPPLSAERWAEEFRLYQRTTEYQVQNRGMSLAEFQSIYWWEWAHRFLGKAIGVLFAVPFVAFLLTRRLSAPIWALGLLALWLAALGALTLQAATDWRAIAIIAVTSLALLTTGCRWGRLWPVVGLLGLGALQGAIGWWMVTSGLFGRLDVSPARLAVHLGLAFAILAIALNLALSAFSWPRAPSRLGAPAWAAWVLIAALFLQVVSGALIAGNDAGGAYPDWPTIGAAWIPEGYSVSLSARAADPAALQFNHRGLGYLVALLCLGVALAAFLRGRGPARALALGVGALGLGQAALGVANLVTGSGLVLSSLHQAGAVALWCAAIALTRAVKLR